MGRARKKTAPMDSKPSAPVVCDYESALVRGALNENEIGAVLELMPETTSPSEIAIRLNLPPQLVRKALEDPKVVQALVIKNFNAQTLWYVSVALTKLRTLIEATQDPELLLRLLKLMGNILAIGERFAKKNPVGRPKNAPVVNVGVQVTPYDQLVRAAESSTPVVDVAVVEEGEDDDE